MAVTIIEFNGIPGTGKTTITNSLIFKLQKKNNIHIYSEKDVFKRKNRFLKTLKIFHPKYRKDDLKLIKIMNVRDWSNFFKVVKIVRYYNEIASFLDSKTDGILILSEGMVQFISVLFDEHEIAKAKNITKFFDQNQLMNHNRYLYVNCNVDAEIAYHRIIDRKSEPNSIDKLDRKKLYPFLQKREKNLKNIRKCITSKKIVDINTEEDIDKSVIKIIEFISKNEQ